MGDDAVEVGAESCCAGDLERCPSGSHQVGNEGSENVGDGFIEKSNNGHPQDPDLECDENHVLSFSVIKAAA